MPRALFMNPSAMDLGVKKAAFSSSFWASETGRTRTPKCCPGACGGIFVWQADTHLPSMLTTQVLHLPFLHLYRMNTSAWEATSLRGWPTRAIVMTFCGWNTTGVSPSSSWPGIILGGSFSSAAREGSSSSGITALSGSTAGSVLWTLSDSRPRGSSSESCCEASPLRAPLRWTAFRFGAHPLRCISASMAAGSMPEVLSWSRSSCSGSVGVLSSAESISARYFLRSSLGCDWSATTFAPAPALDALIRARSSSTPRNEVAAPTTLRVGHGDLGW
mmetsp:Transcript_128495/g.399832  ORF Transcript_128495/g.399832 Transcript_128495/m.399832 type:complete len:275 (+) Transcript_128495:228-1052(+)